MNYPVTPDGRYFVAANRLWRCTDPRISPEDRQRHVNALMDARRAVKHAADDAERRAARARVHAAKLALGERGDGWWSDGAPDLTGRSPKSTPYKDWWNLVVNRSIQRPGSGSGGRSAPNAGEKG